MKTWKTAIFAITAMALISGCTSSNRMKTADFDSIMLYQLRNKAGTEIKITNYGATVTSIKVADRYGNFDDIALGYNRVEDYINAVDKPYFGSIVGRYGNRIAKGKFKHSKASLSFDACTTNLLLFRNTKRTEYYIKRYCQNNNEYTNNLCAL